MDPNQSESHSIGFIGMLKLVAIVLALVIAILGILFVANVVSQQALSDYLLKLLLVGGIILAVSAFISILTRSGKN